MFLGVALNYTIHPKEISKKIQKKQLTKKNNYGNMYLVDTKRYRRTIEIRIEEAEMCKRQKKVKNAYLY